MTELRPSLLSWYERHRRDLPWRRSRDPYAIWVSEIMLQQTRVAAVAERYSAFLKRVPSVQALAAAAEEDVLALWSGLGYYRRARMLHKAAQVVVSSPSGAMPETAEDLRALPGVGAYTSAAIASIAYGEPVSVVDGNVERVLCRLAGWNADRGHTRKVEQLAAQFLDKERPGEFNQALMELGATVCLPGLMPQCLTCPIAQGCKTRGSTRPPRAGDRWSAKWAMRSACGGGETAGIPGAKKFFSSSARPPSPSCPACGNCRRCTKPWGSTCA